MMTLQEWIEMRKRERDSQEPELYVCPRHDPITFPKGKPCDGCLAFLESAPSRSEMTGEQRVAEIAWWTQGDKLTVPFADLKNRISVLVGRPIWTHEFIMLDRLKAEAMIAGGA